MKSEKSSLLRKSFSKCVLSTWVLGAWPSQVTFQVLRGPERQTGEQEPRPHFISEDRKSHEENRLSLYD